ncbi:hypothetical protein CMV_005431 [Castanea mollissima]|uniref:Uncharacterized protein n=1 Tax=Castanea mollissima TaxID=60419 RepID=A0A8J4RR38_9ROSI|nr:hypothetical protein CMV_005431 [Castanea mollissima]
MQKEVHEDFHKILLHPCVGRGSNSVVALGLYHKLMIILKVVPNKGTIHFPDGCLSVIVYSYRSLVGSNE